MANARRPYEVYNGPDYGNNNLFYLYSDDEWGEDACVLADHGNRRRLLELFHDDGTVTNDENAANEILKGLVDDAVEYDDAGDDDVGWHDEDFTLDDFKLRGYRVLDAIHADWIH